MRSIEEVGPLRSAVDKSVFRGGPKVYAKALKTGAFVRIIGVRVRQGIVSGQELSTGRWLVMCEWETRL